MYVCMYVCMKERKHKLYIACLYAYGYCTCIIMYLCMCLYVCMYICTFVCMYVTLCVGGSKRIFVLQ